MQKLPVTDGLALWLDASRIEAAARAAKETLPTRTASSRCGSTAPGKAARAATALSRRSPMLVKAGDAAIVRFDGEDDHLRLTGGKERTRRRSRCSSWSHRGTTPAASAGSSRSTRPNGRDYETGLTIDMGPNGTPRFTELNVEGQGFGGWRNLLKTGGDFGKLYQLEVRGDGEGDPAARGRHADGERRVDAAPLSLDEITVGARYYTNGPGPQEVRGFARCDIAEVLRLQPRADGRRGEEGPRVPRRQVRRR